MMVHTTFGSEEMDITRQLIELVSALLSQRDCLQFGELQCVKMELNSNKAYSVTSTQVTKVSLLCIVLSAFLQMLFGANVPV